MTPELPDTGQTVSVEVESGEMIRGMVVDALSSQFTWLPFDERDARRVRFCFYKDNWQ